jgi:hypothetical protein
VHNKALSPTLGFTHKTRAVSRCSGGQRFSANALPEFEHFGKHHRWFMPAFLDSGSGRRLAAPVSVPPTTWAGAAPGSVCFLMSRSGRRQLLRNDDATARLRLMDRIFLAIIASALLLLFGASGMIVTRTADALHHARTVGVAGSR